MALTPGGVDLILRNFSGFIAGMGKVNASISQMGQQAIKSTKQMNDLGVRAENAQLRAANASTRFQQAQDRQTRATDKAKAALKAYNDAVTQYGDKSKEASAAANRYADAMERQVTAEQNAKIAKNNATIAASRAAQAQEDATISTSNMNNALGMLGASSMGFVGILGRMSVMLTLVAASVAAGMIGFKALGSVILGVANIVEKALVASLNLLVRTVNGILAPIKSVFSAIGNFINSTVGGAIGNLISQLPKAVAEFQRFQVMFLGLAARDISQQFGIDMAQAFNTAAGYAENLFEWVKKLAVTTPFTARGITETVAMANAMGLNIDMAKQMTEAVGNFAAGMGLTEEHMYRIIYNFGQMLAQGKLTGREFRDLAISFVPVWRMMDNMAAKAGMAADKFKKLALEGGVPVMDFFYEFIRMANEDFPGAMDRMARTWEGVMSNAKDFVQVVLGTETFGKVFDEITKRMADALQKLIVVARPVAQAVGSLLKQAWDDLQPAMEAVGRALEYVAGLFGFTGIKAQSLGRVIAYLSAGIEAALYKIAEVIKFIGEYLATNWQAIVNNAKTWGYNIMVMFANGLAAGIGLVTKVINWLSQVISYWLSPGSPPKALPKLPKWGMEAMTEYLKGFTEADFTALKGIQGPLKDAFSILVDTGQMGAKQAGKLYMQISMAIAKALSTGVIDEGIFAKIAKSAGPFGAQIADLARKHVQLALAVKALKQAEEALAAARKKEENLRASINKQVREYNKMLRAGVDKATLATKLAEINATEEAARAATEQRVQQEQTVATMQEQVDKLQEAVDLQEQLVQQLLDITKEQIIPITVDTSAANTALDNLASKLDGLFKPPPEPMITGEEDRLSDKWYMEAARKKNEMMAEFEKNLEQARTDIESMSQELAKIFDPALTNLDELQKAFDSIFGGQDIDKRYKEDLYGGNVSRFQKDVVEPIKKFIKEISALWAGFSAEWNKAWTTMGDAAKKAGIGSPGSPLELVLGLLRDLLQFVLANILFWPMLGAEIAKAGLWFSDLYTQASTWSQQTSASIKQWVTDTAGDFAQWTRDRSADLSTWASETGAKISTWASETGTKISTWVNERGENFRQWNTDTTEKIRTGLATAQTNLNTWAAETGAKVGEWWEGVKAKFGEFWTWVTVTLPASLAQLGTVIKEKFNTFYETYIKPKIDLIHEKFEAFRVWLTETLPSAFADFQAKYLPTIVSAFNSIIDAIKSIVSWANTAIEKLRKLFGMQSDAEEEYEGKSYLGGWVPKGRPRTVGERGWEYFVPRTAGTILNQQQIKQLIVSLNAKQPAFLGDILSRINAPTGMQPVMISAPPTSNVVNLNFGGVVIASEMDMVTFEARVRNVVRQEFA